MSIILPVIGGGSIVKRKSTVRMTDMIVKANLDFSSDDEDDNHHSKKPSRVPSTSASKKSTEVRSHTESHIVSLKLLIREVSESLQSRSMLESFKTSAVPAPATSEYQSLSYEKKRRIGHGASGTVWLASYQNREVAVKEIYLDCSDDYYEYRMKKIQEEFDAHKRLKHPNIIQFYDGELSRDMIIFITEYMKNGSLARYVRDHGPLDEKMTQQTIYQVIQGLAYVHSNGVIHRDIKGDNILIADDSQSVKITDFGVAVSKPDSTSFTNSKCFNGSHHWMAPELFLQDHYDTKVDTWSIGCLAIELLTGKIPFINQAKDVFGLNNMFQKMEKGYFPITDIFTTSTAETVSKIKISDEMMLFFRRVFQCDTKKRHTCIEILENIEQYPWLQLDTIEDIDDPSVDLMKTRCESRGRYGILSRQT